MTARIVVTGNAATAPQVRITSTGRKVANFRIGSTERRQDRASGTWVDGNRFFVGVACWNQLAENVEKSVELGMPLVVIGRISQRTYTDANGKMQFSYEIQADSVAPDLSRGVASFDRVNRHAGPTVAVDEVGEAVVGVSEDEFDGTGAPARRFDLGDPDLEPDFDVDDDGTMISRGTGEVLGNAFTVLQGGADDTDADDTDTEPALTGAPR